MLSDLRFALRQFTKSPGFSAVVILSLALGIAATTTVLCWLQTLVLHPLPGVAAPSRLVALVSNTGGGNASLPDLQDFGKLDRIFTGTIATMSTDACLTLDRQPRWIEAQIVSANFFDLLGVRALHGRTFLPDEDRLPGGNPVLVISERLWRSGFAADPAIIGRTVELNRQSFTIVGVVPAAFLGSNSPTRCEAWAPLSMIAEVRNQSRNFLNSRNARGWHNLARLQPGVSLAQAQAAVATANARFAAEYPKTNRDAQHRVVPLDRVPWGAQTVMGPALGLLLTVCLGVQLIVTANVANLMLARASGRRKEIAVRLSTGATRGRLIRQLLTESLLYAFVGGVLGVLLAWQLVDSLLLFLPAEVARRAQIDFPLDAWSLGLSLLLTLASGLLFGLAPALKSTRPDLVAALKESGRFAAGGAAHNRLRSSLVVAEMALALVLLIGAALCTKGLDQARHIEVGFDPAHVLIAKMRVGMNGHTQETGRLFYRDLRQHLANRPEVEEVALASWFPLGLSGCKGSGAEVEGYVRPRGEDETYEYAIVSPRYFAALHIPLVGGRDFTDADDTTAAPVAIVNEHFAHRFWPGLDPLGRKFRSGGQWRTIVGVAKAGKYNRVDEAARCFFYLPYQQGVPDLDLGLCVRTRGAPTAFAAALRAAVHQLDPRVEFMETITLAGYSSMALFPHVMAANLLIFLGGIALVLAAMGVYAVMSYTVGQRTQEFGVRAALGASPAQLLRLVLGHGLALAAVGLAAGLALSAAGARLLGSFLYGVPPFDPAVFASVAGLLALVAILACWLPARRATKVDPMVALRAE